MQSIKRYMALLAAFVLLAGCAQNGDTNGTGDAELQDDGIAVAEEVQPDQSDSWHRSDHGYRWTDDGRYLVVQQGDDLVYLDGNNNVVKTVEIPIPQNTPADSTSYFGWNDNMVFVGLGGTDPKYQTRVVETENGWQISNGLIATTDGDGVKVFGRLDDRTLAESIEVFESSVPQYIHNTIWLDDDIVAINTQSRVFFYHVPSDELRLIDDMTAQLEAGWSEYMSNSYGALQHWVEDGTYYYTACRRIASSEWRGSYQFTVLYSASWDGERRAVLGEDVHYDVYKIRDGTLIVQNLAPVEEDLPMDYRDLAGNAMEIWYTPLTEIGLRDLGVHYNDGMIAQNDGRYIVLSRTSFPDVGEPVRQFWAWDTEERQQIILQPAALDDEGLPVAYGLWSHHLYAFRAVDGGVEFFYHAIYGEPDPEPGEETVRFFSFNSATGARRELALEYFDEGAVNPAKTHYVAGYAEVQVRALD